MIGAILLLILAFSLGLTLKGGRKPFLLSMIARTAISVANVILDGRMIGADADAQSFFSEAVYRSADINSLSWNIYEVLNGTHGFINVHALVQALLGGPDFFLAHSFSLLGAAAGLWILIKSWLLLYPQGKKYLTWVIMLYTLYPSILTFQSYILREVWQNLCILGLGYLGLEIRVKGWKWWRVLGLVIFCLVGSLLHNAMPLVMPILLFFSIMLSSKVNITNWFSSPARYIQALTIITILSFLIYPLISASPLFKLATQEKLIQATDNYSRSGLMGARSEYGKLFFANKPWTIVPTFLAYELMPIPGSIRNGADLITFVQNLFRVWLIWNYFRYRKYLDSNTRNSISILMLMWLTVDVVYATGTINWGTAVRHHTKSFALLILSGLVSRAKFKEYRFIRIATKGIVTKVIKQETGQLI